MKNAKQRAQRRYEQTDKGKEARRRASRNSSLKLSTVRISNPHKEKLLEVSEATGLSQKDIVEEMIEASWHKHNPEHINNENRHRVRNRES